MAPSYLVGAMTAVTRNRVMKRTINALSGLWVLAGLVVGCESSDRKPGPPRLRGIADLMRGAPTETQSVYLFSSITGLALDAQGRIFIVDSKAAEVRVFSQEGRYEFTFGGAGDGGEELRDPCCVALAPDGRLWILDRGNQRYSVFRLGLRSAFYERSVDLPMPASGRLTRISWDPQGRSILLSDSFSSSSGDFRLVRAFVDSTGAALQQDTLPTPPAESLAVASLTSADGRGTTGVAQPFGAVPLRALGPNGETADAVSSRYAVSWFDVHRRLLRLIQRPADGPKVSRRERQRAQHALASMARNLRISMDAIPFGVPENKAPIKNLGFDLEGRLWVERSVADGAAHEADLYDREGSWIARMEWPSNIWLDLWAVRGDAALGFTTAGPGLEKVVRLHFVAAK